MFLHIFDSKEESHSERLSKLADLTIAQFINEFVVPRENLQAATVATVASGSTSTAADQITALKLENAALKRKLAKNDELELAIASLLLRHRGEEEDDQSTAKRYVQRG